MNVLKTQPGGGDWTEAVGLITAAKYVTQPAVAQHAQGQATAGRLYGLLDRPFPDRVSALAVLQGLGPEERAFVQGLATGQAQPTKLEKLIRDKLTDSEFQQATLTDRPALGSAWSASDLVMGHLALTDLSTGRHTFSELLYRAAPLPGGFTAPGDSLVAWSRGPAGTVRPWMLAWADSGFAFSAHDDRQAIALSLVTVPGKPLVFQGPNGYSRKGPGLSTASQYYSFTRLVTAGSVVVGADTMAVTGSSWMDKEFGSNQLADGQVGWDWFSLKLDDGRELMLYDLRREDGSRDFARGTLIDASGRATYLTAEDWSAAKYYQGTSNPHTFRLTWSAMLVAKQVADLITFSRGLMAFILAGLGLFAGKEALPLVAWVMIADWCGDMVDGPIARRSRVFYHTWIGDHDLQIDMTVSVGLLVYLLGAGYISWWVGVIYLLGWALFFLKCGVLPAPGMLFQAPIYFWFILITLRDVTGLGVLIIVLILAAIIITWPKFPRVVVPGFLDGMGKAFRLIKKP